MLKLHIDRPVEFWKNVLWSNVTKFFDLWISGIFFGKLMSRTTPSTWSNTEVVQSCYGVLFCSRKWKSWLYEGHHEFFEVSSHFGKDGDAFSLQTDAWWTFLKNSHPKVFIQIYWSLVQGSVVECSWVACTVFRFKSHWKHLMELEDQRLSMIWKLFQVRNGPILQ